MKSRILFTKFTWEHAKKQIWMPILILVAFFFVLPVQALLNIQMWKTDTILYSSVSNLQKLFQTMWVDNLLLYAVSIGSGILLGIIGFSYLHSKKKSDFMFSLPFKKETIFFQQFMIGTISFLVPSLIGYMVTILIGTVSGVMTLKALVVAGGIFALQFFLFLIAYLTTVIAMQLTGRVFVGVLGLGTFLGYGMVIYYVYQGYCSTFLSNYYDRGEGIWEVIKLFSPIGLCLKIKNTLFQYMHYKETESIELLKLGGLLIIITGILFFISLILAKKRKAEVAGNSMAFKISQPIVKYAVVPLCALFLGLFFYGTGMGAENAWAIFGIVVGVIGIGGLMEVIYRMEFGGFFRKKLQLGILLVISIGIFCGFRFDIINYDGYLPKQEKIESIAMDLDYYNNTILYKQREEWTQNINNIIQNMELPCDDNVYKMLETVVTESKTTNQQVVNLIDAEEAQKSGNHQSIRVKMNLTNGKKVYRTYSIYSKQIEEYYTLMADTKEYKEAFYPILTLDSSKVQTYELQTRALWESTNQNTSTSSYEAQETQELVELYKEDLRNLKGEDMIGQVPLGKIEFTIDELDYNGEYSSIGYYPVYEKCTNTIEWFKKKGNDLLERKSANNISDIAVTVYSEEEYTVDNENSKAVAGASYDNSYVIHVTSQTDIDEIMPYLVEEEDVDPWMVSDQRYGIGIQYKNMPLVNRGNYYIVLQDQIPEKLKALLEQQKK